MEVSKRIASVSIERGDERIKILFWSLLFVLAFASQSLRAETSSIDTRALSDLVVHPLKSASAIVVSLQRTTVSAEIAAVISSVNVKEGQKVQRGDLLLQLDCTDYLLAQRQANTDLDGEYARKRLADAELSRAQQLLSRNLNSQQEADIRRAEVEVQQAVVEQSKVRLEQASLDVGRCGIVAPFNGVVEKRLASPGQLASVGTPLLEIVGDQELEVSANVSPYDVLQFSKVNDFVFDAGQTYSLNLTRVAAVLSQTTGQQQALFTFAEQSALPGASGKLFWREPRKFIPAKYVQNKNNRLGVYIHKASSTSFIVLESAVPGRPALIDLPEDTQIVVSGYSDIELGRSAK